MKSTKTKRQLRWPKDAIRREIRRLDQQTGLKGADITVRLYEEPEPLGCFTFIDPVRMTFGFSSTRFEDPRFTQAEALDVIRHEYAHFMEYRLFGESTDHGPNWKACCKQIGARPSTYYTEDWKSLARQRDRMAQERNRVDGFSPGKHIVHPAYGEGTVEGIQRMSAMTFVSVRFGQMVKTLDVNWARQNCQYKL